jgi:hypothetical protein
VTTGEPKGHMGPSDVRHHDRQRLAAIATARPAAQLRRAGVRNVLAVALGNLAQALLMTGD